MLLAACRLLLAACRCSRCCIVVVVVFVGVVADPQPDSGRAVGHMPMGSGAAPHRHMSIDSWDPWLRPQIGCPYYIVFGHIDLRKLWKVCKSDFRIAYLTRHLRVEWQYYNVFGDIDLQKSWKVCDSEFRIAYLP